jgi:hypothetical protein
MVKTRNPKSQNQTRKHKIKMSYASPKQINYVTKLMRRHRGTYCPDPTTMTQKDASEWIDRLKAYKPKHGGYIYSKNIRQSVEYNLTNIVVVDLSRERNNKNSY